MTTAVAPVAPGPAATDTFATDIRDAARATNTEALARLATVVSQPDCDPEIAIKVFNATKDVAGSVPDKKADPRAGLAVFNISFINGRMQGTVEVVPQVTAELTPVEVLDVEPEFVLEHAVPPPSLVLTGDSAPIRRGVNADLDLTDLD